MARALELWWHPVCTLEEPRASFPHPCAVILLGRPLAIAEAVPVVSLSETMSKV